MTSPEKLRIPESEEPEAEKAKLELRIEARSVKDVLSGKKEEIIYPEPEEFEAPIAMPIYEEFDAAKSFADLKEEIAAMQGQKISRDARHVRIRARVGEIRERLTYQEKGIAEAIRLLGRAIEKNPDEDDRALFRRVAELAPKYYFSSDELREFWDAIVQYRNKHRHVERIRNEYPDDAALFEACFGRKPAGEIKVEQRPMMLYFRCYSDEDYISAFTFSKTRNDATKITESMREEALATIGMAKYEVNKEELNGVVAIERTKSLVYRAFGSTRVFNLSMNKEILRHEEQHLMNRLFEPMVSRVEEEKVLTSVARTAKTVDEGRRMLMLEFARLARRTMGIDARARDEILAYYKDGTAHAEILKNLTTFPGYDYRNQEYYKDRIANLPKAIVEMMRDKMSAVIYAIGAEGEREVRAAVPLRREVADAEPYIEQAFGEDYKKDLARWVGAIKQLEDKGYGRDEIVSMLYGERIPDWQAFARRAPEKKGGV